MNLAIKCMLRDIKCLARQCPRAGRAEMLELLALELDLDVVRKLSSEVQSAETSSETFYVHRDVDGRFYCNSNSDSSLYSGSEAECLFYCMENNEIDPIWWEKDV